MNCGHMAGASGFSSIHFPFSIEQLKRSGPARRHSTPSAPAGLNFFGRRLMGGPENLPKRLGPSGAKTAWKCPITMQAFGNVSGPGRGAWSFLLDPPLFCSFSGANPRPRKCPFSQGSTGFAAIEVVAKLGGLQAVPGRLARRVKRAWPGGADFYNPGHSCLLPYPLAFSGRKPPCPLPSFKTRPC